MWRASGRYSIHLTAENRLAALESALEARLVPPQLLPGIVAQLPETDHVLFIQRPETVVAEMRAFLLGSRAIR